MVSQPTGFPWPERGLEGGSLAPPAGWQGVAALSPSAYGSCLTATLQGQLPAAGVRKGLSAPGGSIPPLLAAPVCLTIPGWFL